MSKTFIEWTEETWNPIGGCHKVSPGCKNCYAIRVARRLACNPNPKIRNRYAGLTVIEGGQPNWSGKTFIDEAVLLEPLKRRIPTTYFISLSDLFYDQRPDEDIDRVFAVMALAPHHRFLILTKYHERMREYFADEFRWAYVEGAAQKLYSALHPDLDREAIAMNLAVHGPLDNVGLGVSVEDQQRVDERIPVLLQTPAAMRFVSAEPLLGAVDLDQPKCEAHGREFAYMDDELRAECCSECRADGAIGELSYGHWLDPLNGGLAWVIVGGESGPGARPCDVAWIRSIKDQCQAAGVPVFVKQLGAAPYDTDFEGALKREPEVNIAARRAPWLQKFTRVTLPTGQTQNIRYMRLKDPKGGEPSEWPEDLRVRELSAWLSSSVQFREVLPRSDSGSQGGK